ncbi:MAG TPA: carboxypeptidase-like regulatory domain-containing protein, partial [Methanocellaceae archaeon]
LLAVFSIAFLVLIAPAAAQTGIITGMVTSANNAAVPDATVTLTDVENGSAVDFVPNNPQQTSNFSSSLPGTYTFTDVPYGTYYVLAQKDGYSFFTTIEVKAGTATANIVIPEYVAPATATPQPARQRYTYVPVKIAPAPAQATTSRSPGFDLILAFLALTMSIMIVKARKS